MLFCSHTVYGVMFTRGIGTMILKLKINPIGKGIFYQHSQIGFSTGTLYLLYVIPALVESLIMF